MGDCRWRIGEHSGERGVYSPGMRRCSRGEGRATNLGRSTATKGGEGVGCRAGAGVAGVTM
jgi:hypothetical protein